MQIIDAHGHVFRNGYLPRRFLWLSAMRWAYGQYPYRDPNDIFEKIMPDAARRLKLDASTEHLSWDGPAVSTPV
jgi:hypothetical protein